MRTFKVTILMLVLSAVGLLNSGCITLFGPGPGESMPYHVGRDVTVAYLLGQDKLSDEQKQAVAQVYGVFKDVMNGISTANMDKFKDTLKVELRKRIENDKAYAVAINLIDRYWDRLTVKVDWATIQADERVKVLTDFKKGIEDSLDEYSFLL